MISIYTDGSSTGKVGAGGWGFVVIDSGLVVHEAYGSATETTNNRMEIQAVIEAIQWMQDNYHDTASATLYSDSQYVVKGINEWYDGWVLKVKLNLKTVKNWDQWTILGPLMKKSINIRCEWVRGHDGNVWNEHADQLAKKGKGEAYE